MNTKNDTNILLLSTQPCGHIVFCSCICIHVQ